MFTFNVTEQESVGVMIHRYCAQRFPSWAQSANILKESS